MTSILVTFIAALLFALVATPAVKNLALHFNLVDSWSERKIHTGKVPRIGGIAVFLAFFFPFILFRLSKGIHSLAIESVFSDPRSFGFVLSAALVFLTGLVDDVKRLPIVVKFVGQLLAAFVAFYYGFRIINVYIPFVGDISLGIFALPISIFWFVLVINAINLVDGLDGLAAGISLFVSLAMLFICAISNRIVEGLAFASLAGTLIGFLRYNFNPASIFLGDCGSYFLGFSLAALSIAGSVKGQVATAMLIPVIALGVPLIDTLWAPLRRFIFGQKIFQPDREHFHHRLVQMGYTQRRAVLIIYAMTIFLGIGAIILVHARNELAALILLVLGVGVILVTGYVGKSDYFTLHRMSNWAHDLSDEAGLSHQRRTFLQFQVRISKTSTLEDLWNEICNALLFLEIDSAEIIFSVAGLPEDEPLNHEWLVWNRPGYVDDPDADQGCRFTVELPFFPVQEEHCRSLGRLQVVKNKENELSEQNTLKRVEQLRRSIVDALLEMV